ncbi:GNAT family N-acetyltransferase [Modestobacter roseus]|uniref:GNAT family N-acetyltransferase n=1 Tax=Modestobacter roseus TaxID=1181884 RepID=UPI0034DE8EE0
MDLPPFPGPRGRADVSVRPAVADDAEAIARVQVVTWRTAYREVLPAAVLDGWDDTAAADTWRRSIATPPSPAHRVLVAQERDVTVGLAACAPAEDATGLGLLEIVALAVEPRWGRRGHGSRLLAAVADTARDLSAPGLTMWLATADAVTARFLTGAGWAHDGATRTLDAGDALVPQERWHSWFDE